MSDRKTCRYCGKPRATAEDCDEIPEGEGEHLCWEILQGCDQDAEEAIDLRDARIAELERELAAERTLADGLADLLDTALGGFDNQEDPFVVRANNAMTAWKESRSE